MEDHKDAFDKRIIRGNSKRKRRKLTESRTDCEQKNKESREKGKENRENKIAAL